MAAPAPSPEGSVISRTGIGLRAPHMDEVLARGPIAGFLEVHTENYFGGGVKLRKLDRLGQNHPLSFHGVGLSLGRADGLDRDHLRQVAELVERFEPALVSEHLSWSAHGHVATPDLLPVPLTQQALTVFADHVDAMQTALRRQVLIENPSNYISFDGLDFDEPAFLRRLSEMTGCGLLIDINNIYVSAHNLGRDPNAYLKAFEGCRAIGEFHLAGHDEIATDSGPVLIDTHGKRVPDGVWALYANALDLLGDHPTLIEWDTDLPALDVLLAEAAHADGMRARELADA